MHVAAAPPREESQVRMLGEDNPNVMLIGHERLFYNGLLGRACRLRAPGAFVIYASPVGSFGLSIAGGPAQQRRIATVRPYLAHRVTSASDLISVLMIEPESVADDQIRDLEARIGTASGAADIYARIDAAKAALAGTADCSGFASADFDRLFLGRPLAPRPLDERIERTIRRLVHDVPAATVTAQDCAREAGLSKSRYLHLFSQETGLRFRSVRMWKRARALMPHVNGPDNLTHVAMDLGYPDSTHFSHSIRRIYGLTPSSIFRGSRQLRIVPGAHCPAA